MCHRSEYLHHMPIFFSTGVVLFKSNTTQSGRGFNAVITIYFYTSLVELKKRRGGS